MSETNSTPDYKPGDIVNGHRLTETPAGLQWLPVEGAVATHSSSAEEMTENTPKVSTPWYKRKGIIIPAAVVATIIFIGSIGAANRDTDDTAATKPLATAEPTAEATEEATEEAAAEPTVAPVIESVDVPDVSGLTVAEAATILSELGFSIGDAPASDHIVTGTSPAMGDAVDSGTTVNISGEAPAPTMTMGQTNAVKQAESYLRFSSFSRAGLIDQLSSEYGEGFSVEDATFAVDHIEVNWNEQAAKQAASYLELSSFSRDGLYDQLTSEYGEGFTPEQAEYALQSVGY